MNTPHRSGARPARAHFFTILLFACLAWTPAQATVESLPELRKALAVNRALPAPPELTEEALSRRSRVRDVTLSPNGAWLAYQETDGQGASVNVLNLASGATKRLSANVARQELHWSNDSVVLFLAGVDGLQALSVQDGAVSTIAAFDSRLEQKFVARDPRRARHVLVEQFDRAAMRYQLTRLAADGSREELYEGPGKLLDFLLDADGQLAVIITRDDNFEQSVQRRQGGKWSEVTRCKRLRACSLVALDGTRLAMIANRDDDRRALFEFDLAQGNSRLLHSDPLALADLRQVLLAPGSGKPLFAVYDAPRRRNLGLSAAARQAGVDIERRFPDSNISVSASTRHWLLTERGAQLSQERYWLYDPARRSFEPVLEALGDPIPQAQLARKIALDYRASDGVLVHGYLSLPPGRDAATVPLLTMVHGGPWSRVDSDYSALVQLLVNRGVAVFQPNFRASTGHGLLYQLAPGARFGNGRVQGDIIDGVRWLQSHGVGDPRRLAIMGDSFGGYSTLLALTHTPELFQFGMALSPPVDFARTMKLAAAADAPFAMTLADMGIDLGDSAAMKRISDAAPAALAGALRKPLLIMAGARDDKVEIATIRAYAARLKDQDSPVSLLVDPDEGHNPRKAITRQAYVYLLLRLVERYLGGPGVPAAGPELSAYLDLHLKLNGSLP
ncbi:MAG: prolyl oligopeptidase family serine peptidase [Pseudomonadota bacterium]